MTELTFSAMAERFSAFIANRRRFLIMTHKLPDGDAVGAALAVAALVVQRGAEATVVNVDEIPQRYLFLRSAARICKPQALDLSQFDAGIVVDANEFQRLGAVAGLFQGSGLPYFIVDHHPAPEKLRDLHAIDPASSSTCQLIYRLAMHLGFNVTAVIAQALLTGIVYDTNSFRHSRNNVATFRIAADLLDAGADIMQIQRHLFSKKKIGKMRIAERILGRLTLAAQGRIAWSYVDVGELDDLQLVPDDLREIVNWLIDIDGVEAAFLIRSETANRCKISFRSNGSCDIGAVAALNGGGGHRHAAGAYLDLGREQVSRKLLADIAARLEN